MVKQREMEKREQEIARTNLQNVHVELKRASDQVSIPLRVSDELTLHSSLRSFNRPYKRTLVTLHPVLRNSFSVPPAISTMLSTRFSDVMPMGWRKFRRFSFNEVESI
jgi:hypothetical protein